VASPVFKTAWAAVRSPEGSTPFLLRQRKGMITCATSRMSLALARQRLMTARFVCRGRFADQQRRLLCGRRISSFALCDSSRQGPPQVSNTQGPHEPSVRQVQFELRQRHWQRASLGHLARHCASCCLHWPHALFPGWQKPFEQTRLNPQVPPGMQQGWLSPPQAQFPPAQTSPQ